MSPHNLDAHYVGTKRSVFSFDAVCRHQGTPTKGSPLCRHKGPSCCCQVHPPKGRAQAWKDPASSCIILLCYLFFAVLQAEPKSPSFLLGCFYDSESPLQQSVTRWRVSKAWVSWSIHVYSWPFDLATEEQQDCGSEPSMVVTKLGPFECWENSWSVSWGYYVLPLLVYS
jgi:hypothetical protein